MDFFKEGFEYVTANLSSIFGSVSAHQYTGVIKNEIDQMMFKMYEEADRRANLSNELLKGFDAEVWHTYTQRINAAVNGQTSSTYMPESTAVGSADIVLDNGQAYSSKYYGTASQSVGQQATTIRARYEILRKNAEKRGESFLSLEDYMEKYFPNAKNANESIYYTQGRLIPSDQLTQARELLQKRIAKEHASGRTAVAENLQEVLDSLTDTVDDGKGNTSIRLTKQQAELLAKASKDGTLDEVLEKMGITLKDLIKPHDMLREAFKAGLSAAALSFVMNVAPIIINAFSQMVQRGEIDVEQLKKQGFDALNQTAKSFLLGAISSGVTIAAQAGYLGNIMTSADPTLIGATVVLIFTAIENGIKVVNGKLSKEEYAQTMMRSMFISASSVGLGMAVQAIFAEVPVIPYLIGSFVGSALGGFLYNVTEKVFLSYCIESGFTFFGLVKQDYQIDERLLEEIGISTFKEESIDLPLFVPENFESEKFNYQGFQYERVGVTIVRRGIVGVFNIGYY